MNNNQIVKIALLSMALLCAACSPKVENRGYVKLSNWKEVIKPGVSTKQDVLNEFGSPSSQSSFGEETWYYISSRKESVGFMKAEVVEQEVADIKFDASGVVSSLEVYDKDNAKTFDLVKRTTPTEGHSLSFIDQTLGNIGRFNKPGGGDTGMAGGRRPAGRGGF